MPGLQNSHMHVFCNMFEILPGFHLDFLACYPGIMINPISVKVAFCNTSVAKCLVFHSQTPRFRPKNHQNKREKGMNVKKTFVRSKNRQALKMGPLNQQKNDTIHVWASQSPFLCSTMPGGRPRIIPWSPRTPK